MLTSPVEVVSKIVRLVWTGSGGRGSDNGSMFGGMTMTRNELKAADREAAELARGGARLRLRIGEGLHVLAETGGFSELSFSSIRTYAIERCEQGPRWAAESRRVARALLSKDEQGLPEVRAALMSGQLAWSMAELMARHATPEDQAEALAAAGERTVAQMVEWFAERAKAKNAEIEAAIGGDDVSTQEADAGSERSQAGDEGRSTHEGRPMPKKVPVATREEVEEAPTSALRLRLSGQEIVMLQSARMLMEQLDGRPPGDEHFWGMLLAESMSTLTAPKREGLGCAGLLSIDEDALRQRLERALEDQRRRESNAEETLPKKVELEPLPAFEPLPRTAVELDGEVRRCSKLLVVRDLELGRIVGRIFFQRGWKTLGYASMEQYARERIGMSLSGLRQRIRLAKTVEELPEVGEAIEAGKLGFEGASQVGRVANPDTVDAWLDRAERRTIKMLREEVEAVQLRSRISHEASLGPPTEAELEAVQELERAVARGDMIEATIGPKRDQQISVTDGAGCELTFRVSAFVVAELYRQEAAYERVRPPDVSMTFIEFLCVSLWMAWLPTVTGCSIAYTSVYQRDRWKCSNPTCDERGSEPHHVQWRSRQGSDEDENVIALGHQCHRPGVHEGRLHVSGTADDLTWVLGRDPIMIVRGREKENLKH
jgi:hypothetical protein